MTDFDERAARRAKKRKKRILRTLCGILVALALLVLIAVFLITRLLNRISRPEEGPLPAPTQALSTPVPTATPAPAAPSASAAPQATPTPTPTPVPTPLPLQEVYPQSILSEEQYARMEAENQDKENFYNVLLVGVDRRGNSGNSSADTVMVATIDSLHGRLKLTSLLRDILVEIPGQESYGKLNSAASIGGMPLLLDTVNRNFRLDLHEYVLVDFNMFIEIIDRMGGVTVSMSAEEISAANDCIAGLNKQWGVDYLWDGFIFAEEGNVKCTGKQALGYARIRHLDSDFKRTDRQYKVLSAVFATFRSLGPAKQYDLLYDLLPMVETNMSNEAIIDCAMRALGLDTLGILQSHAPAEGSYENGRYERKSVLLSDLTKNALLIHDFIFLSAEEAEEARVLRPGASLPPRTPTPTYAVTDAYGNTVYYFIDGRLVPGQELVYPEGYVPAAPGMYAPTAPLTPTPTPWQSLGDGAAGLPAAQMQQEQAASTPS